MFSSKDLKVQRVRDEATRQAAIEVLRETYEREKSWVADGGKVFEDGDLNRDDVSWFLVQKQDRPVGVLRVMYDPPLELYHQYGLKPMDGTLNVEEFVRNNRIAEIGRFAVIPDERRSFMVAASLMRAATQETLEKGFSHYLTDIFEGEKHSPYLFHTRVMGFTPVATHDVGELNCPCRRITMVLDLKQAYQRLRKSKGWIYRFLTQEWPESLHQQLQNGTVVKGEGDWTSPAPHPAPSMA